jgi:hypothetical protein
VASVEMLLRLAAKGELTLSRGTVEELSEVLAVLPIERPAAAKKRKGRSMITSAGVGDVVVMRSSGELRDG